MCVLLGLPVVDALSCTVHGAPFALASLHVLMHYPESHPGANTMLCKQSGINSGSSPKS